MSEIELPPVTFTPTEVQALSTALAAAVSAGAVTDDGLRSALRKLAATVVCADEKPVRSQQLDLFVAPAADPVDGLPVAPPAGAADRPRLAAVSPLRRQQDQQEPPAPSTAASNVVSLHSRTRGPERVVVDEAVRDTVEQAIQNRRVLRIEYTDGRGSTSTREVEPAGLVAASGKWTLIAWCRSRQEGRGFRLDRVSRADVTSIPCPERDLAAVLGPLGRPAQAR